VIENEVTLCTGLIQVKAGEPFDVSCSFNLTESYTGYISVALFYDETTIPVENFPTVTLLPSLSKKVMLPMVVGGAK